MWLRWIGLTTASSWPATFAFALIWLAPMLAYSPVADRIATALASEPPTLGAFRAVQQGWVGLAAGIAIAWVLGGFIEEIGLRGLVVRHAQAWLVPRVGSLAAVVVAIVLAAALAFIVHLYQGRRGALIVAQLSVLFGMLYAISGYNLWAAIICHGCYDTIAFVRFARGSSKYSKLGHPAG